MHQAFLLYLMLQKKLHSIAMAIVLAYALHALVVVKERVRVVKGVAKTVVRQLVAADVDKVVKDVVMQCVKVIV